MTWTEEKLPANSASLIDLFSQLERSQQKAGNHQIAVMCKSVPQIIIIIIISQLARPLSTVLVMVLEGRQFSVL